jgi:hypothetical protein
MRRLIGGFAALLLLLVPTSADAHEQGTTVQVLAVGDSITWSGIAASPGYGRYLETKVEGHELGKAHYVGAPGTSPCSSPWASWIRTYPKARLDYVVLQDEFGMGDPSSPCPSKDAWRAAWQEVVDAAKAKGAFVIVLDGTHPNLYSVSGIDILDYPVPPSNYGDGVHYTSGGYKLYAKNVVDLLDSLIA